MLADYLRLELTFSITRYFQFNLPEIAAEFLTALPISRVAAAAAYWVVFLVT